MNVFIVFRQGPEWNEPVKCFASKKQAESSAKHRNENKNTNNVHETLSNYVVVQMGVVSQ